MNRHYLLLLASIALLCATVRGNGLGPICGDITNVTDSGCVRYFKGYDVTGVTNNVELPNITSACDCAKACAAANTTCNNWVWKWPEDPASTLNRRSCTLYSNFLLPSGVTIAINVTQSAVGNLDPADNPQTGSNLQPCTFPNGTRDAECFSGPLFSTGTNILC